MVLCCSSRQTPKNSGIIKVQTNVFLNDQLSVLHQSLCPDDVTHHRPAAASSLGEFHHLSGKKPRHTGTACARGTQCKYRVTFLGLQLLRFFPNLNIPSDRSKDSVLSVCHRGQSLPEQLEGGFGVNVLGMFFPQIALELGRIKRG